MLAKRLFISLLFVAGGTKAQNTIALPDILIIPNRYSMQALPVGKSARIKKGLYMLPMMKGCSLLMAISGRNILHQVEGQYGPWPWQLMVKYLSAPRARSVISKPIRVGHLFTLLLILSFLNQKKILLRYGILFCTAKAFSSGHLKEFLNTEIIR